MKADTVFDVSGPVTGQVTINPTTGALVSGDIKVLGSTYNEDGKENRDQGVFDGRGPRTIFHKMLFH